MRGTSILAKLLRMRDELDILIDAAWDEQQAVTPESDADFEASMKYTRWSSVRKLVEDAILEMELWSE